MASNKSWTGNTVTWSSTTDYMPDATTTTVTFTESDFAEALKRAYTTVPWTSIPSSFVASGTVSITFTPQKRFRHGVFESDAPLT